MVAVLFIPVLMWSFVGILVKAASAAFSPAVISVGRFFFGVVFLGAWFLVRRQRPRLDFGLPWIYLAAAGKALNYICENIPMVGGHSWGYIVEQPVQALALLVLSFLYFRERLTRRALAAAVLCVVGVGLVASRGLGQAAGTGAANFLLFAVAAIGASVHFMSQKILMARMDSGSMNLSVFLLATAITVLALPFSGPLITGPIGLRPVAALITLGFVTGASFLIWAAAANRVPFLISGVLANSLAVFAVVWGVVLRGETISGPAMIGVAIFVAGLLVMNLRSRPRDSAVLEAKSRS